MLKGLAPTRLWGSVWTTCILLVGCSWLGYDQPPPVPGEARLGPRDGFVLIAEDKINTGFELLRFGLYGGLVPTVGLPSDLRTRLIAKGWSVTAPNTVQGRPAYMRARREGVCLQYDEFRTAASNSEYVQRQFPAETANARQYPFALFVVVSEGCATLLP